MGVARPSLTALGNRVRHARPAEIGDELAGFTVLNHRARGDLNHDVGGLLTVTPVGGARGAR